MTNTLDEALEHIATQLGTYPNAPEYQPRYGTAGFRAHASLMSGVTSRCGVLAAMRSLQMQKRVGIMVTASHNPECDNGVKLVDHSGALQLRSEDGLLLISRS